MRIPAILLSTLLVLLPAALSAGAWPRERGTWFVSSDVSLTWRRDTQTGAFFVAASETGAVMVPPDLYFGTYLEYGLPHDLTLGLDLGSSGQDLDKAIVFLSLPLRASDTGWRVAAELGLGRIDDRTTLRPGLSLGRGTKAFGLYGWMSADAKAAISDDATRGDLTLDLTYGLSFARGPKAMLQLQSGRPRDADAYVRLAPSVVLPLGRRRHLDLGLLYDLVGEGSLGVKLGLWHEF